MKLHILAASLAVTTLLASTADAAVPRVDPKGVPALTSCGNVGWNGQPMRLEHFDKVIFGVIEPLQSADPADQPTLIQSIQPEEVYDIKIRDNPKTVADLKGKTLTFLGAALTPDNRKRLRIIDVEYTSVCVGAATTAAPN